MSQERDRRPERPVYCGNYEYACVCVNRANRCSGVEGKPNGVLSAKRVVLRSACLRRPQNGGARDSSLL